MIEPLTAAGVDVVIVDGEDLAEQVKAATEDAPIKLGIDAVGGEATARMGDALSEGVTLVNYGAMSGESCAMPPTAFI